MGLLSSKSPAEMIVAMDPKKPKVEDDSDMTSDAGLDSASDAIMAAFKDGDVSKLKSALKSFISMCSDDDDYDKEDKEE